VILTRSARTPGAILRADMTERFDVDGRKRQLFGPDGTARSFLELF